MSALSFIPKSKLQRGRVLWGAMAFLVCGASLPGDESKSKNATTSNSVKHPELEHYSPLWEKSLFTSRALPKPPASGPSFADALTLAGIYEIDGRKIAVVMDKATSQVFEVSATLDKSSDMQMLELDPGTSPYKARVHIQRGGETGWVGMADTMFTGTKSPDIRNGTTPASSPAITVPAEPSPAQQSTKPAPQPTNVAAPGDAPIPPS